MVEKYKNHEPSFANNGIVGVFYIYSPRTDKYSVGGEKNKQGKEKGHQYPKPKIGVIKES